MELDARVAASLCHVKRQTSASRQIQVEVVDSLSLGWWFKLAASSTSGTHRLDRSSSAPTTTTSASASHVPVPAVDVLLA